MSLSMTVSGRTVHAAAMLTQTYHLGLGKLPTGYADPWDLGDTPPNNLSELVVLDIVKGAANTSDLLNVLNVLAVVSVVYNGVPYVAGSDFTHDQAPEAINWNLVGAEPSPGVTYQVTIRQFNAELTTLLEEVGRRESSNVQFCEPDVNGTIEASGQKWSTTLTPTKYLYLEFKFDSADAVGNIIHQFGIFVGTTKALGVPLGQMYLEPADIDDPGELYQIENVEPFTRNAGKRENYEVVLTF